MPPQLNLGLLLAILLLGTSLSLQAEPSQDPGEALYNLTDHGSPLTTRVTLPANWLPAISNLNYQGRLDVHWLVELPTDHARVDISREHAVALGAPNDFNLITAPDNCWGMFMNFGLIRLTQKSDLKITVAADESQGSQFAPAFGLYRGWDTSSSSSRHGTLFFGYDNPLGTQGLTFRGDAYSANDETSVTQSFQNLEPGQYELFVTSRTNHSSDGAYTVALETLPAGSSTPTDPSNLLCGPANNAAYVKPPPAAELCRWGQPVNVRTLKQQRYTWTCNGPGTRLDTAQCYTLGNTHKQNQAPLVLTPGNTSILAGKDSTQTISGGSGNGPLKITKGYASFGTRCLFRRKGDKLLVRTQGQAGECRFKVSKAGDKQYHEVESPSLTIKVAK